MDRGYFLDLDLDFYRGLLDQLSDGVYFVDRERRITYWNRGAERLTGYRAEEVVGRTCADSILVHLDDDGNQLCACDKCPAFAAMCSEQMVEKRVHALHKDGHRVPLRTRVGPLRDREGRLVGAVEVFSDDSKFVAAEDEIRALQQAALLDPLTGIGNRAFARKQIQDRLSELERYGWSFGVLFADIDHFKRINDEFGHDTGDEVIRLLAKTKNCVASSSTRAGPPTRAASGPRSRSGPPSRGRRTRWRRWSAERTSCSTPASGAAATA